MRMVGEDLCWIIERSVAYGLFAIVIILVKAGYRMLVGQAGSYREWGFGHLRSIGIERKRRD